MFLDDHLIYFPFLAFSEGKGQDFWSLGVVDQTEQIVYDVVLNS